MTLLHLNARTGQLLLTEYHKRDLRREPWVRVLTRHPLVLCGGELRDALRADAERLAGITNRHVVRDELTHHLNHQVGDPCLGRFQRRSCLIQLAPARKHVDTVHHDCGDVHGNVLERVPGRERHPFPGHS